MSFRVGRKVGKYYISHGKSGTRISTKVGGYNVSYFKSNKSKAKSEKAGGYWDMSGEYSGGEIATDEEDHAITKTIIWNIALSLFFVFLVWATSHFWIPLGICLVVQAVGSFYIWSGVDSGSKWFMLFFPIIAPIITPLALAWIVIIFGVAIWLM